MCLVECAILFLFLLFISSKAVFIVSQAFQKVNTISTIKLVLMYF